MKMSVSKEIKKLRRMLKDSSVAHAIFGWLSEYQRNTESMMVDKAEYSARVWARENFDHEVEVTRSEVISIMRELEELQLGRFIVGRRGAESRFEFWTSRVQIGQAAMGQIDEINIEEDPVVLEEHEVLEAHKMLIAHALEVPVGSIRIKIKG
tara:strand:- start:1210 stop:1668 length:459 start_codon:yes stop_codon:yes gene_type:complete